MAQPHTTTLTHSTVKRCPSEVASSARASSRDCSGHQASTQRNKGAKQRSTSTWRRCVPALSCAGKYHSRKRWRSVRSDWPNSSDSITLTWLNPQLRLSTMPRLHRAKTPACGRLRWGRYLDTVAFHCDTRGEQVIHSLRYLLVVINIGEHSMSCSSLPPLSSLSQKPTRVSPCGAALETSN